VGLFEDQVKILRAIALAGCIIAGALTCPGQSKPGDVIFQTGFEGSGVLREWDAAQNQNVRIAPGYASPQSLLVESPALSPGAVVRIPLPVEKMRGCRLICRAMLKADDVTQPPHPWNGIKVMLHIKSPDGDIWPQQGDTSGTFDWKRVQFKTAIPANATSAELVLGLEAVKGRVQFDNLTITVEHGPREHPATPLAGPVFTGHDEPRLRGAMISPDITPESLRLLGQTWNANLIRWQLIRTGTSSHITKPAEYETWLEESLHRLDAMLPLCEQYGVRVVVDLHSPFGGAPTSSGYAGSDTGLFTSKEAQKIFVEDWQRIALRYRDSHAVWGYDLANEPVEGDVAEGCDGWNALATRAAQAVRLSDTRHAIIVEPEPGGGPDAIENLDPIPVPGVVYSVHMYVPSQFTQQGIFGLPMGVAYPGVIGGSPWDAAALRHVLQPVRDWQRDHGVQIYVGEFSAIRWAPENSASRYLSDCINIFEEFGWDWSYHAFREWNGWSVEHGPDKEDATPVKTPTDREKLLREWYAKNVKTK